MSAIDQAPPDSKEAVAEIAKTDQAITSVPNNPVKNENIFNGVHFCLCDDVKDIDEIKKILVDGGGKLVNYLSDVVTHLIADNPDQSDVLEALELYEKPVVIKCDAETLWAMVTYHGGVVKLQLDHTCTHLVVPKPEGSKYEKSRDRLKIVTPDWVIDCIKNKQICDEETYHPKLLVTYCTRPRPQPPSAETLRPRSSATNTPAPIRNITSLSPRQARILNQGPMRPVQAPKSAQRLPTPPAPLTITPTHQFNPEQGQLWSNQQQGMQQHFMNRSPGYMDNRMRFDGNSQQIQMSPRNQVFLSLQQQPQVRQQQQQLNFVQVRHVSNNNSNNCQSQQQQYQQMQNQTQPSQKPPNVILQQRIQPPVHTLSLNQQQQQQQAMPPQNMILQANQHPNQVVFQQQQQQQMITMQRHPDPRQQMYRQQNFIQQNAGFVGQPRVARVPQMRMSQVPGPGPQQMRGQMPCGPQQMMPSYGPESQRMVMRQPMDMNQNQMYRQQGVVRNQTWNEIPPQMVRGQGMPVNSQNFPGPSYNQMMWSSQPSAPPQLPAPAPSTPTPVHEGGRGSKSNSPRSGEKRNSSNLSSPKSGTLSSVSSASITSSAGSTPANSALVTSKTKTALANLLNTRLQNSGPSTTSSSRNFHEPSSVTFSGSASTSSSNSSTSTPTSLTAPATLPPSSLQSGEGSSTLVSCCPLSPSNRLVCVGSPGVILPTGEILHRGLLESQPVQERFIGHDPSLTIPGELCLIGCVFFLTGYEKGTFVLNQKQRELLASRIQRSGGQVEAVYSNKVTHVMSDSQDAPGVDQAIRDGKRLVTVYWLDAVIKTEKKLKVPWRVIHVPRSPRFLPANEEIIASSGFSVLERTLIREVCIQIGALYTPHFSTKNTVLVCKKLEGEKFMKSGEWSIPVVNVQWLNDVALGVNDAMKKPYGCNPKHKTFDLKDPFDLIDTQSIRNIMIGWVQPICVTEEELNLAIQKKKQEDTDRLQIENGQEKNKESDDDVFAKPPAKKLKVSENVAPDGIKKPEDSQLPPPPPLTLAPFATVPLKVMITGTDKREKTRLEAILKKLGAKTTTKAAECTHLISEGAVRTVKFFCALNHATYIVSKSWVTQSEQNNSFVSESGHEIQEVKSALAKRKERGNKPLLDRKVIYITPGCIPSPSILSEIVQSAGGTPVTSRGPTTTQLEKMKERGLEFIILTKKETDIHLIDKYLERDVTCLTPEWLLNSVMAQDLFPYSDYRVTID